MTVLINGNALIVSSPPFQVLPQGYVNGLAVLRLSATQVQIGAGTARDFTNAADVVNGATLTVDISVIGVNGLDVGPEFANTFYAIHVISGPAVATAGILSLSATAPTFPTGYTNARRVGWVRNDATANFRQFSYFGSGHTRTCEYNNEPRANLQALTAGAATAFTNVSLAAFLPSTARRAELELDINIGINGFCELRTPGSALANSTAPVRVQQEVAGIQSGHVRVTTDVGRSIDYRNSAAAGSTDVFVYSFDDDLTAP